MNKFDTTITLAALAAALAVPILAAAGSVPAALAAGSCSTFALLGLSHVAFWPSRDKMHRPIAYAIGVSCIGAGMLLFSILTQLYIVVIAFVGIALPGGLLIAAAWWLRAAGVMPADRLARRAEESRAALRELDTRRN